QAAALERERAKRAEPGPPASSAAVGFMLPLTRSAEAFPSDAPRVPIHAADAWVVLALEYDGGSEERRHAGEVAAGGGRVVLRQDDIRSASHGIVAVSVDARLIGAGGHVARLDGIAANGRRVPVGRYPFQVLRER